MNASSEKPGPVWPVVKTSFFFVLVPGTFAGYFPYSMLTRRGLWVVPEIGALELLALGLVALGVAGLLWAGWHFATTGRGTPAPFDPPKFLVARGPYRYVRNPMYLSLLLVLLGQSLFFSSALVLRYAAVCWVCVHLFVLLYEEPTLQHKFGASYEAYCKAVPRWLPRM